MNNVDNTLVLFEPTPARDKLKHDLEILLGKLKNNIIPEEHEISVLKQSFQDHKDEESLIKEKKERLEREDENKDPSSIENQVEFNDILPDEKDVVFDIDSFSIIENVRIVKSLMLEKLVPEISNEGYSQFIEYLMENGYITKVSVELMGERQSYHMLTTKGWHMIKQKKNIDAAVNTDPSFVIPDRMISDPKNWGTEVFLQAVMLRDYYESIGASGFAIFTNEEDEQMLFGCEIRDSYSVSYSFAACFVPEREKDEAAILYRIARSDKIADLTIILMNEDEEKRLKLQRGLDTRTMNKLRYYVLSGEE